MPKGQPGNVSALEDECLVVRCQLGERPAFDELIQRWHEPIWKYVRRQVGNDDAANEIAQDFWIRVLRSISRLRDGSKLRAWLFSLARRTWLDRLRQHYAAPPLTDEDLSDVPAAELSGDIEGEILVMERELSRLPPTEREVLTLFYLRELSLDEVAQVLEIPVGTVKSRLFRARRLLRRELEPKGDIA